MRMCMVYKCLRTQIKTIEFTKFDYRKCNLSCKKHNKLNDFLRESRASRRHVNKYIVYMLYEWTTLTHIWYLSKRCHIYKILMYIAMVGGSNVHIWIRIFVTCAAAEILAMDIHTRKVSSIDEKFELMQRALYIVGGGSEVGGWLLGWLSIHLLNHIFPFDYIIYSVELLDVPRAAHIHTIHNCVKSRKTLI